MNQCLINSHYEVQIVSILTYELKDDKIQQIIITQIIKHWNLLPIAQKRERERHNSEVKEGFFFLTFLVLKKKNVVFSSNIIPFH